MVSSWLASAKDCTHLLAAATAAHPHHCDFPTPPIGFLESLVTRHAAEIVGCALSLFVNDGVSNYRRDPNESPTTRGASLLAEVQRPKEGC